MLLGTLCKDSRLETPILIGFQLLSSISERLQRLVRAPTIPTELCLIHFQQFIDSKKPWGKENLVIFTLDHLSSLKIMYI